MMLSIRTRLTLWYGSILLAIVLVIGPLSYSMLRWSVMRDLDASLVTVAAVIHDLHDASPGADGRAPAIGDQFGFELSDKLVRFLDPAGRAAAVTASARAAALPMSDTARARALEGERFVETVRLPSGDRVRLLTAPVFTDERLVRLVQVGMPLAPAERTLARYAETLLVVLPLGFVLALAGGSLVARSALAPVDAMSRAARRITAEDLTGRVRVRGTGDELDRLADTLNSMLSRLEDAFVQMRRFTADAAHELRTPLTVLKGEMEVALRAERASPEYRRVLASALEEVDRLSGLANDLLLLSRASAHGGVPREEVDLEAVVLDVFDAGARLARGGLTIRLDRTAPARVCGDAGAFRRAVLNLVENAVKYTAPGGSVRLALDADGSIGRISVRDTGVGIPPADTDRIFEAFVRLDPARARDTGGAGLGLAIARSIVVAHRGTIGVTSVVGEGSTFTIEIPLA